MAAAATMVQKISGSAAPMMVPMPTSMAQNGRISETNASDSPKASTNTMSADQL
jgi:hypothetical protein